MKRFLPYCFLMVLLGSAVFTASAQEEVEILQESEELPDTVVPLVNPMALYESLGTPEVNEKIVNMSFMPRVFQGYRKVHSTPEFSKKPFYRGVAGFVPVNGNLVVIKEVEGELADSIAAGEGGALLVEEVAEIPVVEELVSDGGPSLLVLEMPEWFEQAIRHQTLQEDMKYLYMLENPGQIQYAYWDLPSPPVLLVEDRSFMAFLRKQELPEVDPDDAVLPDTEVKKKHWLHKFGTQLQFSQAYVSPNWYQGGNSYLSMLFNFNWNVQLNQVYHPNLLFQSDLSYKVAFSSNPKGYMHKYTIAEDNFQYNLNTGLKAAKNWYYSYNLQFKTQLFNNFEENTDTRTAAFLSPADLNMGLGMSYNHSNKLKTFQITATVSPLSYNLKICLKPNDIIDHAAYGIAADKHTKSEIGSNVDVNMDWKITTNISYKTRLFMFTDYKYFLTDWQNTFNFDINKFLSTQLFVHLRYDGSVESYGKWKKFMLREILSFGLSYTFSTKP